MSNRPWIVKAGGNLLDSPQSLTKLLWNVADFQRTHSTLFVHGGGPLIEKELRRRQIPFKTHGGRRVTTPAIMEVVENILSGQVNKLLSAELNFRGTPAVGISCRDGGIMRGRPLPHLGRAAAPWKINPHLLRILLRAHILPVISPVASDAQGDPVNINADDAASAIAGALKAEGLIYLTHVDGIYNHDRRRFRSLSTREINRLLKKRIIQGGMIPKVQSALNALHKDVRRVYILNGTGSLRLNKGTKITRS